MAGAFAGSGNTLPRSEANIWFDPEAAAEIFAAFEGRDRLPLAIGLDVTERVVLTSADVETICGPAPSSALGRLIADATSFYIAFEASARPEVCGFLHDPLAVAAAIDPALVTTKAAHVEVELEGRHTRGETVADFHRSGAIPSTLRTAFRKRQTTSSRRWGPMRVPSSRGSSTASAASSTLARDRLGHARGDRRDQRRHGGIDRGAATRGGDRHGRVLLDASRRQGREPGGGSRKSIGRDTEAGRRSAGDAHRSGR